MVKQDVTQEYARDMGFKFGFSGETKEWPEFFSMSDQQQHKFINIYKFTGAIDYGYDPFILSQDLKLPSYEEALSIAVKKLKETGLLPTEKFTSNVISGGSEDIIVTIKYPVDGHPVGGISYSVRVGHLGQVVKVSGNPAKYTVYQQAELKSIGQAYRELVKTKRKYIGVGGDWVSINDVSISYWRESKYLPQEYLYPVYIFKGSCSQWIPGLNSEPFTGWAAATFDSPLEFPTILAIPDSDYVKSSTILLSNRCASSLTINLRIY